MLYGELYRKDSEELVTLTVHPEITGRMMSFNPAKHTSIGWCRNLWASSGGPNIQHLLYHAHVNEAVDTHTGLIDPIILSRCGVLQLNVKLKGREPNEMTVRH